MRPIWSGVTRRPRPFYRPRIAEALGQGEPRPAQARLETAEAVLEAWPVPTSWGGTRACYSPGLDQIRMPEPEAFTSREAFCRHLGPRAGP
jgi:antirestriction protein ArdC